MIAHFRWVASADHVAHAVPARGGGWSDRTACGIPTTDERPIRAERQRCERCLARLGLRP